MNKQETMRLIDNDIKRIESKILPETKWLLIDEKELIVYFEDFIWKNKDFYQGITEKKEFNKYPKDFQNRVREILEDLEDELNTIDAYFDMKGEFIYNNFWNFVGDFIKEDLISEFITLNRNKCEFFLREKYNDGTPDEDGIRFNKTLEFLAEEFIGEEI